MSTHGKVSQHMGMRTVLMELEKFGMSNTLRSYLCNRFMVNKAYFTAYHKSLTTHHTHLY